MDDSAAKPGEQATEARNPYRFEWDEDLELFARGVIDEAMAKTATSPRQFAYYSTMAAKRIVQHVLQKFQRRRGGR